MPDTTSGFTTGDVTVLLDKVLGSPVTDLRVQTGGTIASVFRFTAHHVEYVVRLAARVIAPFAKEAFITAHYATPAVPIPRIVANGVVGDWCYAVSEAVPGIHFDTLPPDDAAALVPQLLDILDAIHGAETSITTGWGQIGDDGNGTSPGWKHWLAQMADFGHLNPYHGTWQNVLDATMLEREDIAPLTRQLSESLPVCPEDRTLLHGDYGFTNVLVANGRITAVLDWANAQYGDAVFDLAWLDFWGEGMGYAETGRRRVAVRGNDLTGFAERLACYQTYIALDALRFFAMRGDASSVGWVRDRVRTLELDRGT